MDTYDTVAGVRRAIEVCRELDIEPRGVRLDSGDLGELAIEARRLLDNAGFADAVVIASGGLDEHVIHELVASGAPIDGFGVGTSLTVSQDHPGLDIVYKLVAYDGRPVAKFSGVKSTFPGPKQVWRPDEGIPADVLSVRDGQESGQPLLRPVWRRRTAGGARGSPDRARTGRARPGRAAQELTEQVRRQAFGPL